MNQREFARPAEASPSVAETGNVSRPITGEPLIIHPDRARVYDIGGGEARILVDAEQSQGEWWLGTFRSDPGRLTSLHVHNSFDEGFYVLDGTMSVWLKGAWEELPVGAVATVPRQIPHALGNRGARPARYLVSGNPAGFERFFVDIAAIASRIPYGSPEFFTELAAIYGKYDSEILGPPPGG